MVQRFGLEGFYLYDQLPTGKGRLTGEIQLAKGVFEGEIYDHGSVSPNQTVKGHLYSGAGLDNLSFLKFPPNMRLANLTYSLSRDFVASREGFEGTYKGRWGALPTRVDFFPNLGLFVAQSDISLCLLGDEAEITLSRK